MRCTSALSITGKARSSVAGVDTTAKTNSLKCQRMTLNCPTARLWRPPGGAAATVAPGFSPRSGGPATAGGRVSVSEDSDVAGPVQPGPEGPEVVGYGGLVVLAALATFVPLALLP